MKSLFGGILENILKYEAGWMISWNSQFQILVGGYCHKTIIGV